ncbi:hypothetical protein BKA70DRAFT_1527779 [Coprinopsis sp. MPI-PUGE-AT-0042]|nr:hypothetical protein BKA70DRAFT_1527779 [Coprinopsis sp. MPI-PUGE-AT-0042]
MNHVKHLRAHSCLKTSLGTPFRRLRLTLSQQTHRGLRAHYSSQSKHVHEVQRVISTLDPRKLTPADHITLAGLQRPAVHFGNNPSVARALLDYGCIGTGVREEWPESASGFLYFTRPSSPNVHPAAGSIRFRVTPSKDPSSFEKGYDITRGYSPWHIQLLFLQHGLSQRPIYDYLKHEGLVTARDEEVTQQLLKCKVRRQTRVLDDICQPFVFELDIVCQKMVILAQDAIYAIRLRDVTVPYKTRRKAHSTSQGTGLVQFELNAEHQLVLRLLKYLSPASARSTELAQQEGELVMRYLPAAKGMLDSSVWAVDPYSMLSPSSVDVLARKYVF